ncbi:MAG: MBL fold metallo-hydrolase [Terrimicrobiaceae bacterium]|jgi:L-ascorbate metabolism protein UlaG (beta-lactamase superfamily)
MGTLTRHDGGFSEFWSQPEPNGFSLFWLGQAGFAIHAGSHRFLVDPYLSDSLEVKYRGSDKPHNRLIPAPARVEDFTGLDYVFCTHAHSDHMDPGTLPAIARAFPDCRFVIPQAHWEKARQIGVPDAAILTIDAGQSLELDCLKVRAIPAAHEQIQTDADGHHHFLGYLWNDRGVTIYHSGDSIPYDGLSTAIGRADLALLPVNGRGKGVQGNFTFEEAARLCQEANIPSLIPHHFGMFAFNTTDRAALEMDAARTSSPQILLPDVTSWISIKT